MRTTTLTTGTPTGSSTQGPIEGSATSIGELTNGTMGALTGTDNSARYVIGNNTTLTYALWALGHHRDLQDKVRAEVGGIGDRELTPEDVPALRYTVQVLHEALRLCPPGAAASRIAMKDIEVDGYRVEAGTMLLVGIYALHRDAHSAVFIASIIIAAFVFWTHRANIGRLRRGEEHRFVRKETAS